MITKPTSRYYFAISASTLLAVAVAFVCNRNDPSPPTFNSHQQRQELPKATPKYFSTYDVRDRAFSRLRFFMSESIIAYLPKVDSLIDASVGGDPGETQIGAQANPPTDFHWKDSLQFRFLGDYDRCRANLAVGLSALGYKLIEEEPAGGFRATRFESNQYVLRISNNTSEAGDSRSIDPTGSWRPHLADRKYVKIVWEEERQMLADQERESHRIDDPPVGQHGLDFLVEGYKKR